MRTIFLFLFIFRSFYFFSQETGYTFNSIRKDLIENANAIVRLDEMDIHVLSSNKMIYTVNQVVTVLNKLGDKHARSHVFYDKDKKIKSIEAYIYDQSGKEIERIKKKDFQDVSAADGFSLYIDDRILQYRYTPVQYPYTMRFTYEIETADTGSFPSWYFLSNYLVSVEKSGYTISYASNELKPIIKEHNLSGFGIFRSEDTGKVSYEAKDIPALKYESLGPDFGRIAPYLSVRLRNFYYKGNFVEVDDWKDLGLWIEDRLLKGRDELPEATKIMAQTLVNGVSDDLEKAKIIYKYVQDHTRYISVQIGIGGLRPISAIEVDRVKYGDCKGLSNYAKALMQAVGVKAYYAVIEAGNAKVDFESDFADLKQGNHVILAIPYKGDYHWIDCTSQTLPFGFVGDFTDDRKALVVKPEGSELVKTVAYLNEQNHQDTKAEFGLSSEGAIKGEVQITTKGVQFHKHYRLETQNADEIKKHYKSYWSDINNLKVNSYEFLNDREEVVFGEKVNFMAANYASISGSRILFAPNVLNRNSYVPDRYRDRKQPFEIQRGYLDEDEYEINIPEGYALEAMPDPYQIETEFGHYRTQLKKRETANTLVYSRSLLIKEGSYPKEKYEAYREFRKKISSGDNMQVVLVKNNQ